MGHTSTETLTEPVYMSTIVEDFQVGAKKYNKFLGDLLLEIGDNEKKRHIVT